jgi:gluconokinase
MPYVDGDDLHPKSNVEKMSAGHPLNDVDREPWLGLIRTTAEHITGERRQTDSQKKGIVGVVIGCSALKRYYRDILRGIIKLATKDQEVHSHSDPAQPNLLSTYFVFIEGSRETLMERMEKRADHFMKASMLDSQLETLESPIGEEGVAVVSLNDTTDMQVMQALEGLRVLPGFKIMEQR